MVSAAETTMRQARAGLIFTEPFYQTIAMGLHLQEDPSVQTMCTDGKRLRYNPAFVAGLSLAEVKTVLAHEAMHVLSMHHLRGRRRCHPGTNGRVRGPGRLRRNRGRRPSVYPAA